ncbi:MAG TPA: protein kinase [Pyrinomonadaceae bacterium]|nr:protein kinase [Pyrinomonadaceae bacterium]
MIGSTLGNYRILDKLGAGGQGTVYKALDNKLGRTVVIKVLPAELTSKPANLKRFEREARLASALDHPNICTIFDLNEINGIHFIAMQLIEGRNVRDLVGGRPLELQSALSITIQVTDALVAAHARGIIHRDIKAGNVMVNSAGQAKVLDFGLAKLLDEDMARSSGIHHTELTEVGVPYGTATYAAPEQARGDRVDSRADIFSTGVLLYEMLTGIWPFRGKTAVDVRHAVLHDEPVPIAEARPSAVPPRLQQILDRALAKDPRDRYQKIGELREDLKSVLNEVRSGTAAQYEDAAPLVAPRHLNPQSPVQRALRWFKSLTGSDGGTPPSTTSRPTPSDAHETPSTSVGDKARKSVAILAFKNVGNDPETSFYEFSLADAVITELAHVRSLIVRPSSSIAKYQNQDIDPLEVGRQLSVNAILTASFVRAGKHIRVTAQLLDVRSSEILWSDRIDADAGDIIAVQDAIVQHIVDGLRLELSSDEKGELVKGMSANAEATEQYLRGRDCMGRFIYHTVSREHVDSAIEHFERAIKLDQKFALAYSALGGCYVTRVLKGLGEPGDHEKAEDAFDMALTLEPKLLEARMHMVFIYLSRNEKPKARVEVERLRDEFPNDVGVHFVRGILGRLDGDYERALRSFERMVRLNPGELVVASYNRARIFMYQHRWEDALAELDRGAAVEPDHPLVRTFRARVLFYRGEVEAARRVLENTLENHPKMDGIRPILATCLAAQNKRSEALSQLSPKIKEVAAADHDIAYWLGSVYALLDEQDDAVHWLETANKLGNENYPWFKSDPNWNLLKDNPRYQQLMAKLESDFNTRQRD